MALYLQGPDGIRRKIEPPKPREEDDVSFDKDITYHLERAKRLAGEIVTAASSLNRFYNGKCRMKPDVPNGLLSDLLLPPAFIETPGIEHRPGPFKNYAQIQTGPFGAYWRVVYMIAHPCRFVTDSLSEQSFEEMTHSLQEMILDVKKVTEIDDARYFLTAFHMSVSCAKERLTQIMKTRPLVTPDALGGKSLDKGTLAWGCANFMMEKLLEFIKRLKGRERDLLKQIDRGGIVIDKSKVAELNRIKKVQVACDRADGKIHPGPKLSENKQTQVCAFLHVKQLSNERMKVLQEKILDWTNHHLDSENGDVYSKEQLLSFGKACMRAAKNEEINSRNCDNCLSHEACYYWRQSKSTK